MPRPSCHEINRDRMVQGRVGIYHKVGVAQEGDLEFVRSKFDDIEFFSEFIPRREHGDKLIQFHPII